MIFVKSSRGTRVAIIAGPVSKRGDGSVGRCGDCATLCVFCVRRGLRRSGGVVRGRLRRPCRPLQVIGVLAAEMSSGKFKPKFSGDRAMLALQRQLADDPGLIPEPSFKAAPVIRPLLIRLCSVAALAAFVAWGVVSYSDVKKTAGIATSTPAIVSKHVSAVDQRHKSIAITID